MIRDDSDNFGSEDCQDTWLISGLRLEMHQTESPAGF